MFLLISLFHGSILAEPTPITASLTNTLVTRNTDICPSIPPQFDQRSTWNILSTCLATAFACSWVAVHPNIPPPGAKWWYIGLTRLGLMLMTIVAPELILLWAMRQWMGARELEQRYKDEGWTKIHGYFIQMGGFMLFDGAVMKGVVSPKRLEDLMRKRQIMFPEVTKEEIEDRSKGDGISKGLVIIQTAWFVAQLVARLVEGLAVTQLEVVTFGFATLNGFTYLFWWNKPLDIRLPIPIYLLHPIVPNDNHIACGPPHPMDFSSDLPQNDDASIKAHSAPPIHGINLTSASGIPPSHTTAEEEPLTGTNVNAQDEFIDAEQLNCVRPLYSREEISDLETQAIDPNTEVSFDVEDEESSNSRVRVHTKEHGWRASMDWRPDYLYNTLTADFLLLKVTSVPVFFNSRVPNKMIAWADIFVSAFGMVFAAIHCAGRNLSFPTKTEANLWQISSFAMLGYAALFVIGCIYLLVRVYFLDGNIGPRSKGYPSFWNICSQFLLGLCAVIYIVARIYVLLEAFLALRDLPCSATYDVQWTTYLPHI